MKTQKHEAESATFWFIKGENDALAALPPQHRDRYYYMMGWHDAIYEISLGIIIYLEELSTSASNSVGLGLLQLIVEPEKSAAARAKNLLAQAQQSSSVIPSEVIIELIETAMVYKFPQLSRQEIAQMLGLVELQQTRVYQEGQEQGERKLILKQLARRLGTIPPEITREIEALRLEKLEALGEALLDFSGLDDLTVWLQNL